MPDPELDAALARIRQKKAADPAGFAAKLAAARQAAGDDTEFHAVLDEIDAQPAWQEAPLGARLQSTAKQMILGTGAGISAIPAAVEALGRKAVAATARAFDSATGRTQGAFAQADSADVAEASPGPLGSYLSSLREVQRQQALKDGYDQPTGAKGFAIRTAEGLINSAPIMVGGAAGAVGRAGIGMAESAGYAASQAGLMGAQTAQQTITEAAARDPTAPIPAADVVNAAAQGAIGYGTGLKLGTTGWLAAFDPKRAVVPIGQRAAEAVATSAGAMGLQGELGALAAVGAQEGRIATPEEQLEGTAQGVVGGALFGLLDPVHAIAETFAGRRQVKVALDRMDAATTAGDAANAEPVARALARPDAYAPPIKGAPTEQVAVAEAPAGPIERPIAPAPPAEAPAAPPVEAEHPNLEGTRDLLAKGRKVAVEVDEDHADILGRAAGMVEDVDAEGAYVRAADGDLVHIPGEAIVGVADVTDHAPSAKAPTDAGRAGRAAEPAAARPVAVVDEAPAARAEPKPPAARAPAERPVLGPGDAAREPAPVAPSRVPMTDRVSAKDAPGLRLRSEAHARGELETKPGVGEETRVDHPAVKREPIPRQKVGTDEPPLAEAHVRLYHGGSTVERGGPQWFTSHRPKAEGHARKAGGAVAYVDLPHSHPAVRDHLRDETGFPTGATVDAELPGEIASGRKPLVEKPTPKSEPAAKPVEKAAKPVVENVSKEAPKSGDSFVVRAPGGKAEALGVTVVERVGHNHFIVKTPDRQFAVAGVDRASVARARRRGTRIPLQLADPSLGRAPRDGEGHSGRPPTKYRTIEEARAAAQKASNAYGEPEDVLGGARKQAAGAGPTGGRNAEAPIDVVATADAEAKPLEKQADALLAGKKTPAQVEAELAGKPAAAEPAPVARTKAERTEAKQAAKAAGEAPAEAFDVHANELKAAERIQRAREQIEEAPAHLADVQRAVREARKEFHEGLAPDSILHAYGRSIFGENRLASLMRGLTGDPKMDGVIFARALSAIHADILRAGVEAARTIRMLEGRASLPTRLADRLGLADGMSETARHDALHDLAKSLGVTLTIHDEVIHHGGRAVGGFYDPITDSVVISKPRSFLAGAKVIAHEAVHAEIKRLGGTAKQALFDAVASAIGDPMMHAELVAKRWGKLIPKAADPLHGPLEETLADAGADALLTNHNQILGELPAEVGSKLVRALHKVGNAIMRMVRKLAGTDGLKANERKAMKDIAERLLRVRIERARAANGKAETLNERMASLMEEAKGTPEPLPIVDPKSGDLHQRVLDNVAKLGTSRDTATKVQEASIAVHADLLHVANDFPMVDAVAQGIERANAAHHARLSQVEADVGPALKHFESRPGMKGKLHELRLADIARQEAGKGRFSAKEGLDWLRERGASAADLQHAQTLWTAFGMLREAHLDALARVLGLKRAFSAEETKAMLTDFEGLPKTAQVEGMRETLEAWHDTATEFENSTSNVYMPLVRLAADDVVRVVVDGKTVVNKPVPRGARDKLMAELQAKYPDGEVTSAPQQAHFDESPAADRLLDRFRAAAAKAGLSGTDVAPLIDIVRPAMLSHLLDTTRLKARGVEGFETDLGKAVAFYTKGANAGIRRIDTLARTRDPLAVLAEGANAKVNARPRLAEFARGVVTADPETSPLWAGVRQAVATRVLSSGFAAAQNVLSGVTLNPFILARLTGKLVGPVSGVMTEMAKVGANIPAQMHDVLNLVTSKLEAGSHVVEAAAERIGGAAGEALRKALRETDVLKDPELSLLDDHLTPGATAAAAKTMRAAMALFVVSDRVQRTATFAAAFKTAERFTAADWEHVREKSGYHRAQDPYEFAVWATRNVVGAYGAQYRPPAFRGAKSAMLFQMAGWSKHTTQAMVSLAKGMRGQRGLVSMGALAAMSAIGTMAHGLKGGIPLFGQLATDAFDFVSKMAGGRDYDQMLEDGIASADRAGDSAEAFGLRLLRGGAGDAAAGATAKGSVGHRIAAAAQSVAAGTKPGGLLVSTLTGRLSGAKGTPAIRAAAEMADGVSDISGGIKADNGEAVARGIARIIGGPVSGGFRAGEVLAGKGVTQPLASDGKAGHTVTPSAGWEDAALLAGGFEPAESARLRTLNRNLAEQHTLQQASLDTRVYAIVDAMRGGDAETIASANAELGDYVRTQAKRLGTTTDPGERARLYAELGWMLGKNPSRELENRIKQAWLNRKFGLDVPLANPDWFMKQQSAAAAGGTAEGE